MSERTPNLSERQRDVLNYVATHLTIHQVSPTYREICAALGTESTNTVMGHVNALIRKGYVYKSGVQGSPRALSLTKLGRSVATYDGGRILGELSGLGTQAVHDAWNAAKANHATLEACAGPHVFRRPADAKPGTRFTCELCGGTLGPVEVSWYDKGLAHALAHLERP